MVDVVTPVPADPPTVPGERASDLAREALRQVVEHWPGDLRGVSLTVREPTQWTGLRFRMGAVVTVSSADRQPPLGRVLHFTAAELRHRSPACAQRVRREHRAWERGA